MENLSSIFFYNLERAIKTYRQFAQAKLRENGFEITIDQWMVLKAISDNEDISHNDLSETVFKDKASVTRITEMLINSNLLEYNRHPDSGRRRQLSVTTKGQKLLKSIRPLVLKNRKQALKNIKESELKVTEKVLRLITENTKKGKNAKD